MAQNERRLIDANELMTNAYRLDEQQKTDVWHTSDIEYLVMAQPTVDAVEVVHGRWIVSGCGFDCCSECRKVYADGYLTAMGIKARTQFNYCPNCGAKMDGGNEDG